MFYESIHSGISDYFRREDGKNFNFPLHLHNSFELISIVSGTMEITVEQNKYVLKENDCLLIFPNQLHSLSSDFCEHVLYIFSPDLIHSYSAKVGRCVPVNNQFNIDASTYELLLNLLNESSFLEKKGVLYLVCEKFNQCAEYKNILNGDPDLLQQIFEFVKNNYMFDCSLKTLCREKGYSYSFLSRFFKKTTGVGFNNYVNQYRIEKSCYLLRTTNLSIIECAVEVGYSCLRSFNRNFLLYTNQTPHHYRKNNKTNATFNQDSSKF